MLCAYSPYVFIAGLVFNLARAVVVELASDFIVAKLAGRHYSARAANRAFGTSYKAASSANLRNEKSFQRVSYKASVMPNKLMDKWIIIFSILFIQGCTSYARLTYTFEKSGSVPEIYYDSGAEDIANKIEVVLSSSLDAVKKQQYADFKNVEAIKIYTFSSKERYSKFSGSTPKARGSAIKNEVYISPIIRKRINTLKSILTHELSHVHLRQYIGTWRYWTEVPGWFHEGLAVEVSGGGGAEKITDEEAIQAIKEGVHFVPREESNILGHKFAHDYGLKPQMYYRQSYLFVHYLIASNPESFKNAYLSLIEGEEFKDIWLSHYGKSIPQLWLEYLRNVKA